MFFGSRKIHRFYIRRAEDSTRIFQGGKKTRTFLQTSPRKITKFKKMPTNCTININVHSTWTDYWIKFFIFGAFPITFYRYYNVKGSFTGLKRKIKECDKAWNKLTLAANKTWFRHSSTYVLLFIINILFRFRFGFCDFTIIL